MKQVLWPKYLLGGMLQRQGGGMGDVESQGFGRDIRGLVGRWPDADGILQGGLSDGLRDWDLWSVSSHPVYGQRTEFHRGPLIFTLLLSVLLSLRASKDQTDLVFAGVFSIVWVGEAVVTLQIKLLGGNMCVWLSLSTYGY